MTASSAFDATVRAGIAADDRRARFEEEAIPYMGQMFPAALRLTRDRCDAEDLIQDTFARAYVKFHQFSPGTNLRAWLHRIMFHTFYSACRKRRSRPPEVLAADLYDALEAQPGPVLAARSAEADALDNLAGSSVMRSLGELPQCFKAVIYLADVQGYQYNEIADMLGIPLGTVMSRIHRGRKLLRGKLERPVASRRAGQRPAGVTTLSAGPAADGLTPLAA